MKLAIIRDIVIAAITWFLLSVDVLLADNGVWGDKIPIGGNSYPSVRVDVEGQVICKDVDKIVAALPYITRQCCVDIDCKELATCGIFKPMITDKIYKDKDGEYYRVRKGNYIGLEKRHD